MSLPREPHTVHGRRPKPERDPLVGTRLDDRYHIEARIATGGFGAVYRARNAEGMLVALKVLHPSLTHDPNMVARFRREGATLTQLHDPHTVTTLAVGETADGTLYIAMELLTGESLYDRLVRLGSLPWRTAVAIARAVCSSLAEAHALGVVHRDLKPANIHVESRHGADFVKVIDFGIVKVAPGSSVDDGRELTCAGHMIGTFDYMSPEQLLGAECRDLSDVYAVGAVLYEMLTGRRPFAQATSPAAMMTAMLTETPEPPSRRVLIPRELCQLVMRCLEREPQDRFASIIALAAALDRVIVAHDAVHEAVTTVSSAWDPTPTIVDERTWIDPATRPVPDAALCGDCRDERAEAADRGDHGATIRDPWHLPITPRIRTGDTGPVARTTPRGFGLSVESPPSAPRTTPTYTTLPGIAVVGGPPTPPRGMRIAATPAAASPIARGSERALRGSVPDLRSSAPALPRGATVLPTTYPMVPNGWRAHAQDPLRIATRAASSPPVASGSAAALATRPLATAWRLIWLALVVACLTTLVLAIALGAIP